MSGALTELPEVVRASPQRVGDHDKEGWLALFTSDAIIEDPVGTTPHKRGHYRGRRGRGDDALGRFYETFIAPNQIVFEVERDLIAGDEVVREVQIHTTLSTGFKVTVPAHIHYLVRTEEGVTRIAHLTAVWELARLTGKSLKGGPRAWWSMLKLFGRMLRVQGLRGVAGYLQGFVRGIGRRGRRAVARFADAVSNGDEPALAALFGPDDATIELPIGRSLRPRELLSELGPSARLTVRSIQAAGWLTTCAFDLEAATPRSGIAFFELEPSTRRIRSARFFCEPP